MSIGTLYEYIRTKEDILYLVCDYIHSNVREKVRPSLTITGDSTDTLKRAIRAYFIVIDEMQDYIVFLYQETKSLNHLIIPPAKPIWTKTITRDPDKDFAMLLYATPFKYNMRHRFLLPQYSQG